VENTNRTQQQQQQQQGRVTTWALTGLSECYVVGIGFNVAFKITQFGAGAMHIPYASTNNDNISSFNSKSSTSGPGC